MKLLFKILVCIVLIAACCAMSGFALEMRRDTIKLQACLSVAQQSLRDLADELQRTRSTSLELAAELNRYREANENAVAVMRSIRDRAVEARENKQWFDALVVLDSMATLAQVFPDSSRLLVEFRAVYDLTIAAANAARKAAGHGDSQSSIEGGGDRGVESRQGRGRSAA